MTHGFIREEFDSIADMVAAVIQHDSTGGALHDRRLVLQATPAGLNQAIPSEGGFLVDTQHAFDVWEKAQSVGQILQRCRKQPITSKANKLRLPTVNETSRAHGSRSGGMALAWLDEAQEFPQSRPKYGDMTLGGKLLGGIIYITNELLADSPAFNAWFPTAAGREVAFVTEDAIISGSGAGRPLGVLKSDALITVTPESGQGSSTLLAENCTKMAARLWSGSYQSPGTAWVTSNDGFQQLEGQRKTNGAPLVEYVGNQRFVLGWPLLISEYAQPLGSAGDLILVDFGEYIISERESGILGSLHLRFLHDESVLRIKTRIDGQLGWSSPITPKNSDIGQSPAVTLGTR